MGIARGVVGVVGGGSLGSWRDGLVAKTGLGLGGEGEGEGACLARSGRGEWAADGGSTMVFGGA